MRAGALLAASARRRLGSVILLAATTAATVAALGTFAAAAFSPSFAAIADYRVYVRRAFEGASVAMALFVVLSGWFLSEHYLAGRRRELSLWLLAGMRRRDALAELSLELAAALGCGLAGGLAAGALLSRFFSLVLGALMKLGSPPELPYALAPIAACAATVLLQYGLAVAKAWSEISHSSISALLRSEREPE
ncbi:MAG: hypothetical protein Q8M76_01980 [Spirochaetaceae bacterium]|nr:hypothetical protein [Spirochaetaceae bacterium]